MLDQLNRIRRELHRIKDRGGREIISNLREKWKDVGDDEKGSWDRSLGNACSDREETGPEGFKLDELSVV